MILKTEVNGRVSKKGSFISIFRELSIYIIYNTDIVIKLPNKDKSNLILIQKYPQNNCQVFLKQFDLDFLNDHMNLIYMFFH